MLVGVDIDKDEYVLKFSDKNFEVSRILIKTINSNDLSFAEYSQDSFSDLRIGRYGNGCEVYIDSISFRLDEGSGCYDLIYDNLFLRDNDSFSRATETVNNSRIDDPVLLMLSVWQYLSYRFKFYNGLSFSNQNEVGLLVNALAIYTYKVIQTGNNFCYDYGRYISFFEDFFSGVDFPSGSVISTRKDLRQSYLSFLSFKWHYEVVIKESGLAIKTLEKIISFSKEDYVDQVSFSLNVSNAYVVYAFFYSEIVEHHDKSRRAIYQLYDFLKKISRCLPDKPMSYGKFKDFTALSKAVEILILLLEKIEKSTPRSDKLTHEYIAKHFLRVQSKSINDAFCCFDISEVVD